ncbi:hypothetical protein JQ596_08545 [Bradyrhizobium manausense]|uniref:hypothetical protein n=1 Tax=Bradyrhizobium manausense TaxID=989370 RepID=UPI001BA76EE9|nr:hypothetical protein [Bradyrhizobium manausense]MBR0825584.1 hypothetical protein [Bradyrhizobium manausense]
MPILNKIAEIVDGVETTMEEQVYVVRVENGGQSYWLRDTVMTADIDRAEGFETIERAAVALRNAEKFMAPAIRKKCVIVPYGGDFVAA